MLEETKEENDLGKIFISIDENRRILTEIKGMKEIQLSDLEEKKEEFEEVELGDLEIEVGDLVYKKNGKFYKAKKPIEYNFHHKGVIYKLDKNGALITQKGKHVSLELTKEILTTMESRKI